MKPDEKVMSTVPVLLLCKDDVLCRHWEGLDPDSWTPVRAAVLSQLDEWCARGNSLVVMDADMADLPAWNDPAMAETLRRLNVVVASMRPNDEEGRAALMAGAKGYIHAYIPVSALETVLRTVHSGSVWLGPTLLARLLRQVDEHLPRRDAWHAGLTLREREVAERVAAGHSNQAIADALSITERTVRAHLSAVFEKLGVTDRLMLALKVHGVGQGSLPGHGGRCGPGLVGSRLAPDFRR